MISGFNFKGVDIMDALFGLIVLFLIGVWAVWVIKGNQQRPRKNERFIGYINRYDEDGEPYQAQVWHMTEDDGDD